jgi:hypothetical protein
MINIAPIVSISLDIANIPVRMDAMSTGITITTTCMRYLAIITWLFRTGNIPMIHRLFPSMDIILDIGVARHDTIINAPTI